jgi:hypothetical protein
MRKLFGLPAAVILRIAAVLTAADIRPMLPPDSDLQITVHVYNISQVPAETLAAAETQVSTVFERAGIHVLWVSGPLTPAEVWESEDRSNPSVRSDIFLRIYNQSMVKPWRVNDSALGFVVPFENSDAIVFYDRVQRLCQVRQSEPAPILGAAMAHEIGHLMLGSEQHSPTGMMRENWLSSDLIAASQGLLRFRAGEATLMRAEVQRRKHAAR